jgi:hypothetical protein
MSISVAPLYYRFVGRTRFVLAAILTLAQMLAAQAATQSTFLFGAPFGGRYAPETYSLEPFSREGLLSSKYQQVYQASEFGLHGLPGVISEIRFLTDENADPRFSARLQIEILFGITDKNSDQLSSTFAENVGAGLTTAFPHGEAFVGGPTLSFVLPKPFTYDPSQGNLLLEFRNYSPIPPPPNFLTPSPLDAWDVQGDSVSRVYAHDVNATTGTADTMGLTTYFIVTPIPVLAVSLQSSNLMVRWASYASSGFILKQSPVLPGVFWQPAGGTVVTNGSYIEVTLPLDQQAGARFFRLVYAPSPLGAAGVQTINGSSTLLNQDR